MAITTARTRPANLFRTTAIDECFANRESGDSSAILIFFFQDEYVTALSLFESLTKQLIAAVVCIGTPCPSKILSALEEAYGEKNLRLQISEVVLDLILPLCSLLQKVTLVIDGVDECKRSETRLIWKWLEKILEQVSTKVLISSQDQTSLHFKGYDRIQIDQQYNKADIDTYIDQQIAEKSGPGQIFGDETLRKAVKSKLQDTADGMFLWIHLVLKIILDECDCPRDVEIAVESLPSDLEAIYLRCLARKRSDSCTLVGKRADRPLCDINLLIWVCAAPDPLCIDSLQELLAMDMTTGHVIRNNIRTEESLLHSGVGLITLDDAEQLVLPVHSTARDFIFSEAARQHFCSMSTEANFWRSWPLCINAELWSERTFRSALGSLCLSFIKQRTSRELAGRPEPMNVRIPQPKIPRLVQWFTSPRSRSRVAEITVESSLFRHAAHQLPVENFLKYAIRHWLPCNKVIASDSAELPWTAQGSRRKRSKTSAELFAQMAKERNDSFGVHPWHAIPGSSTSHLSNMFAHAVVNDHVPLMQVVKQNRRILPPDVFDRPLPQHGSMLAIHVATKRGFMGIVSELLDICDMSSVNQSTGESVLHFAAKTGDKDGFEMLLVTGRVEVNLQDDLKRTPLHQATENGHEAIVKLLLATDRVNANLQDNAGKTSLHWATAAGNEAIVKLLLATDRVEVDLQDDAGKTPLHWATENGHEATVKLLLTTDRVEVNLQDKTGRTALHWAVAQGHEAVVKLLLATDRVNVNLQDDAGRAPLHWATTNGQEAALKLLLATERVEANKHDDAGWPPLRRAAENGHEAAVKLLLATDRVQVNLKYRSGETLLHWAASHGRKGVVNLLLATDRVEMNSKDNYGDTPLHWATTHGHEAVVKLLIAGEKLEMNSRNNAGETPLHWAAKNGREAIVKLLLARERIEIDCHDNDGETPLHWAAKNGREEVVKLLLATDRAETALKNKSGERPLDLAVAAKHKTIVKLLR